jgi:hypothetical protein
VISPKLMSLYRLVLVDSTKKSYEIPILQFHGDYFHSIKKKKKKKKKEKNYENRKRRKKRKEKAKSVDNKNRSFMGSKKNFSIFFSSIDPKC